MVDTERKKQVELCKHVYLNVDPGSVKDVKVKNASESS